MSATAATEEIRVGEIVIRWLVDGAATGGTVAMFEFEVPNGTQAPPAHSHDSWDETVYGVRGTLTWTVDGVTREVGEGEVLHIPSEVVHRFENRSGEPALQLAVITPGVLGPGYFRDLAELVDVGGPPDFGAILEAMRRHGLMPAV